METTVQAQMSERASAHYDLGAPSLVRTSFAKVAASSSPSLFRVRVWGLGFRATATATARARGRVRARARAPVRVRARVRQSAG